MGKVIITADIMKFICPHLTDGLATAVADVCNKVLPGYGMDNTEIFPEFISRCIVECSRFTSFTENLNYSAERLHAVWPSRFKTVTDAKPYEHNPEKLANHVYADRMGNGNETSGDGWRFRGGGALQLTGRGIHTEYARYKKQDVITTADWVRIDLLWALDSACWVFAVKKQLMDEAEADEFVKINRAINGGDLGLKEAGEYYGRAKKIFNV